MFSESIFSTYKTGENRVTASILAVLRSLSLGRIERLIGALLEQSEFQLVRFENQIAKGGGGVPDAMISSSCHILIETKTKRGAVRTPQLQEHLRKLQSAHEVNRALIVLSPDDHEPEAVSSVTEGNVVWSSFARFSQAIDELLADPSEVISEREGFLLRELQSMFLEEGLIGWENLVVVIAARHAWPEYQEHCAYVCQPNRAFQSVERIAFYYNGQIQPLVPKIIKCQEDWSSVPFRRNEHSGWLGELVHRFLDKGPRQDGESHTVMRLSAPDDKDTVKLDGPIPNDLESKSGRPVAFTQGQRYVLLDRLRTAKRTSDLVEK